MKVVMDEKIPFLRDALLAMGHTVVALPGVAISHSDVKDADALFVRTRTECNASLLSGSNVRLIGTATIGYDHIDSEYCAKNNIRWVSAPGCNADAVLQYVQSSIYCWVQEKNRSLDGLTLGIVGVGEIGRRIARWAQSIGLNLLLNDPPRGLAEGGDDFVPLSCIAEKCDIITFHPTLSRDGDFPSYHLADEAFFRSLRRCPLFINASRGPVVDNAALVEAIDNNLVCDAVVDVWENEPDINPTLLNKTFIATPHIAGYSAEGKLNASRMMLHAFVDFFSCGTEVPSIALPALSDSLIVAATLPEALLSIYSPLSDTAVLKNSPATFEKQRNNYKLRREPSAFKIEIK